MRDQNSYVAYLIANQVSEKFLLAYARAESGDETAEYSRVRALQTVRELAAHLGFALVEPVEIIAPAPVPEPSNVVQIGSDYQRTVDTVSTIMGGDAA